MTKTLSLRATAFAAFVLLATCAADAGAATQRPEGVPVGHPKNPETWYALAESLSEQAKDTSLTPDAARALVLRGLEVNEQALVLNPVYYEALNLKAALLRKRATSEKDRSVQKKLIADAEAISAKASEIAKKSGR